MVSGKSVRAGKAFVELTLRDFVSAGLKVVQAKLKAFAASVRAAGMAMVKLGTLIGAPLALAGLHFAKMGENLQKMSIRTGTTVEFLSKLSHAAQIAGTSVEDMEKGFKAQARFMLGAGQGLMTQTRALDALGLKFRDLKGMNPEDMFMAMASSLSKIEDKTLQSGLALQIFGRAGANMLPMLEMGADGLNDMMEEAERLGLVMSKEDADAAAILTDKMTELWSTVKMAVFHIGAGLAPLLTKIATKLRKWGTTALEWIKTHRSLIVLVAKFAAGIMLIGFGLMVLSPAISAVAVAVGVLTTAIGVLQGVLAFMLSPLGIAIGAFVLLAHATGNLANITAEAGNQVLDGWDKMSEIAMTTFGGITDALMSGEWGLAAKIGMAGLKASWKSGGGALKEAWIGVKYSFLNIMDNMMTGAKKMWATMQGHAKKAWAQIKALFDDTVDPVAVAAAVDAETKLRHKALEKEKRAKVDANNAEVAAQMKNIKQEGDAAMEELNRLREEAARRRAEHEKLLGEKIKPPKLPDIDKLPGWDAFEATAAKISAAGAFSAAAVSRMGGGLKGPEEETADNTAKTVEELNAINHHLRQKTNVGGAYALFN